MNSKNTKMSIFICCTITVTAVLGETYPQGVWYHCNEEISRSSAINQKASIDICSSSKDLVFNSDDQICLPKCTSKIFGVNFFYSEIWFWTLSVTGFLSMLPIFLIFACKPSKLTYPSRCFIFIVMFSNLICVAYTMQGYYGRTGVVCESLNSDRIFSSLDHRKIRVLLYLY